MAVSKCQTDANEDEICLFYCKKIGTMMKDWHYEDDYGTECAPICIHHNQFCNGVLDVYPNETNGTNSNVYLAYCNETSSYRYRRQSDQLNLLVDEMNCDLYVELLDASLIINIAISGIAIFISLMTSILLGKPLAKLILFLYNNFNEILISVLPNPKHVEEHDTQVMDLPE